MKIKIMGHQVIGYPNLETNREMIKRMTVQGFDFIELQLPYSEPVADGELFQKANQGALSRGMTIASAIDFVQEQVLKTDLPIYVMTYYNPIIAYGEESFIRKMISIGVKGLIVPDAPFDQSMKFWEQCRHYQLNLVPIATLNTSEDRIKEMCRLGSGFLYFVPRLGVTGTKSQIDYEILSQLDRLKEIVELPIGVGFGLEDHSDLDQLEGHCDIAIFGSVLLKTLEQGGLNEVDKLLGALKGELHQSYKKVIDGISLSEGEAKRLMEAMLANMLSDVKLAAILSHYSRALPTLTELNGFIKAIKGHQINLPKPKYEVLDNCGTGGDAIGSFNISTISAFVAAAAGVKVAKHGNRAMTSQCGGIDLLEKLGIRFDKENNKAEKSLGIDFYFAQDCHPMLKEVSSLRKELGFKTIFNLMGPLLSPVNAKYQLIGVYDEKIMPLMANWIAQDPEKHALLVHGKDGLDELSISGPSLIYEVKNSQIIKKEVHPEGLGLSTFPLEDIKGGTTAENERILLNVLKGEGSPAQKQIVQLNAGAAIYLYGLEKTLEEGIRTAKRILESGEGLSILNQLKKEVS